MGGARRRAHRDSLSLPHGYHERGAVVVCVREQKRADGRRPIVASGSSLK
jgi:hypothetical protein